MEKTKEYNRNYYLQNKERIIEMIKEKNNKLKLCECGCLVKKLSVHRKSKRHKEIMEGDIDIVEAPKQRLVKTFK